MPLLGNLLKKGIKIRESLDQEYSSPHDLQKIELKKLLITSRNTLFGKNYNFNKILNSFRSSQLQVFYQAYKSSVPIYSYERIYSEWWSMCQKGKANVCWPGMVNYYALSSGTSGSPSKYIPITQSMTKAIRKTSIRQMLTLSKYDLPDHLFTSGILMIGGSTDLNFNGRYFEGDLTGIQASHLPFWFQHFYKPGKKIASNRNWNDKLDEITRSAPEWDIGIIVGVPAWIQILLEKIISYYNVKHIHEIWPNLMIYVHGGVFFDPYKKGFQKLLGRSIYYINTYLASEGFIAFQAKPNKSSMRLVLNNGIFYEFIPFNRKNFTENGELINNPEVLMIDEVVEGKEYALLISSCAGAWRYFIGDTIKFISKQDSEIEITGRTKHFLSLSGEHLSVENMNKAIELVSNQLDIDIKEFTVVGTPKDNLFAHHWFIGTDNQVNESILKTKLDSTLMELNDDYRVERSAALQDIILEVVPSSLFYKWMKEHGKEGGQNKFPRVLNENQYNSWTKFLEREGVMH